jgi:hypothetical protein
MKSLPATSYSPSSTGIYQQIVHIEGSSLFNDVYQLGDVSASKLTAPIQKAAVSLNQTASQHSQNGVRNISRQSQIELARVILEQWMTEVFINQIHNLNHKAKAEFAKALNTACQPNADSTNKTNSPLHAPSPAIIRSPFELPLQQRSAIQKTLYKTFNVDIALSYETTPNLVSTIELHANGQKLAC